MYVSCEHFLENVSHQFVRYTTNYTICSAADYIVYYDYEFDV